MANDRFLSMFFEEARELLQALEAGLMDLEARREDRAHLDRTFRAAHTLKGAAGMVGLGSIAAFTHKVEAVLDRVRGGTLPVTPEVITELLAARDHLVAAVEAEEAGRPLAAPTALEGRLAALLEGRTPPPAEPEPIPVPEPVAVGSYRIRFEPKSDLLRKGVSPLGILAEVRELGEARVVADWGRVPPLEELDPRDCYLAWTVELSAVADPARLDELFLFLDDREQLSIRPLVADESPPAAAAAPPPPRPAAPARIRVEADQLDQLVGMAGELALLTDNLQGLRELKGVGPWLGSIEALERIARRLRDTTLELRMVPVEELFVRFPRLVRDLAERSGKQIALRLEGEDTRLDRTIIERLAEPMIHLIRNAVDHGLETPAERRAAGKPAAGRITIGAEYAGDRVAIRVAEDGRGLDRARIVRKGVAAGLLPPDASPDDPRVVNVIFEPGFSTRDQVGELSGRGVGLDVVRDTIRALRGSLSVRSEAGKGTTFLLRLPLTLAMIDGLLVEADGARLVVPMGQVEECVAVAEGETMPAMGRTAAIVRGEYVPIVALRGPDGAVAEGDRRELLITRHAERRVAVAVDRLLGRVQAVIQPLDEGLGELRRFSGATILGDGSICLIVDLATVVAEARAVDLYANTTPAPR